jgi:hypothetical protein
VRGGGVEPSPPICIPTVELCILSIEPHRRAVPLPMPVSFLAVQRKTMPKPRWILIQRQLTDLVLISDLTGGLHLPGLKRKPLSLGCA